VRVSGRVLVLEVSKKLSKKVFLTHEIANRLKAVTEGGSGLPNSLEGLVGMGAFSILLFSGDVVLCSFLEKGCKLMV